MPTPTSTSTSANQRGLSSSLMSAASGDALSGEIPYIPEAEWEETPLHRTRREQVQRYKRRKAINVGMLFALWYILSMAYNIFSKKVLILAPELAWTAAWFQMALGLLYVGPIWLSGLRKKPQLSFDGFKHLLPVAMLHSLVHVGGVVSMGAGAVSFTYIVKASEPAVSAALAAILLQTFLPVPVYLTLIPVMAGVALSSVSELTFNWKAFNYAMISNVASASRGIVGKKSMGKALGKNLNAMNMYAILTIMSAILLLPIALILEGPIFLSTMKSIFEAEKGRAYLVQTLLAAICYYTYNEVSFICLDNVSPVSHALANTLKRVFIIISSMLVFGNKMTGRGIVGSTMAIGGVLLYSLAKAKIPVKKKEKRKERKES